MDFLNWYAQHPVIGTILVCVLGSFATASVYGVVSNIAVVFRGYPKTVTWHDGKNEVAEQRP